MRRRLFALLASHAIAAYACGCVIVLSNLQSLSSSQLLTPSFVIPSVLAPLTILPTLAVSPWFFREFGLPSWKLAVLWAAYFIPLFATYNCLTRKRNHAGSCTQCGYSLIGNTSGICPECGKAIEATAAPAPMHALPKDRTASQRYLDLALDRFRKLAGRGDVEAMTNLGFVFHQGLGVEMDGSEAIRWYSQAFEAGNLGASNGLCLVYYEGDPKVRDKAKALYWYTKANEFHCRCIEISEFEADAAKTSAPR